MKERVDGQQTVVLGGATFVIRVQYRQHASWQGTIKWLDQQTSMPFRSILEMMLLIQEALDQTDGPGAAPVHASWKDKDGAG